MIAKVRFGKTNPLGGGASQMPVKIDGLEAAVFQIDWTRGKDRRWTYNSGRPAYAFLDDCRGKTLKQVKDAIRTAIAEAPEPSPEDEQDLPELDAADGEAAVEVSALDKMLAQYESGHYRPGGPQERAVACPVCETKGEVAINARNDHAHCSHRMNGTWRMEDMWICSDCGICYCIQCTRGHVAVT